MNRFISSVVLRVISQSYNGRQNRFWSVMAHFPPFPPNNVDFSIFSTAQTIAPTQHLIGGLGVSEN